MKLSEFITPNLIIIEEKVESWKELVLLLLNRLDKEAILLKPVEEVYKALEEREKISSTIFDQGLAIPHAKTGSPAELTVALALLREPLEVNGRSIRLMALIITSQNTADLYLTSLVALSHLVDKMNSENLFDTVATKEALWEILLDSGLELDTILRARHIMKRDYITVQENDSLDKLNNLFTLNKLGYVPVVDDDNNFKGEARLRGMLGLAIPDYAKRVGGLKFLASFEPFNQFSQLKKDLKVADILEPAGYIATPETPIVELVFNIVISSLRNIPIVEEGKLIGMIGFDEILERILSEC